MNAVPPKKMIYIAQEPPDAPVGMDRTLIYCAFRVTIDQLEINAPAIYEKLKAEGKQTAQILAVHANDSGNLSFQGWDAIERFKPDVIYSCYTEEVRRNYPDLPVQGWYERNLYCHGIPGTLLVEVRD